MGGGGGIIKDLFILCVHGDVCAGVQCERIIYTEPREPAGISSTRDLAQPFHHVNKLAGTLDTLYSCLITHTHTT